jgi:hypothetical protein
MWVAICEKKPPVGKIIKTRIETSLGIRNESELIFERNLWWMADKSMYVYYTPTHWFME